MAQFQLPKDIRFSEECGLNLLFQEVRLRGSTDFSCQVLVTEIGDGHELNEPFSFSSWEEMKEQFPTMMDFLKELSCDPNWNSDWRENDRIYFIESSEGHEGLYDLDKTVWFDAQTEESSDDETKPTTKKKAKKK